MILSDKTISPATLTPYVFNSSTNSRYNNTKFKRLLIDSSASTQSTDGIEKLKKL